MLVIVHLGVDAASRVEALEKLAGGKAVHALHPTLLKGQDAVIPQIHSAVGDVARMLPGHNELAFLQDPRVPLGQLREEEDVPLLQRPRHRHILPLGPVALTVDQTPCGVEELEQEHWYANRVRMAEGTSAPLGEMFTALSGDKDKFKKTAKAQMCPNMVKLAAYQRMMQKGSGITK